MSSEARAPVVIATKLLYSRPTSAAVKLRLGDDAHTLTLACKNGRFEPGLTTAVETVLQAWFGYGSAAAKPAQVIAKLIRDRHERQLVQPEDPRRLPLTLPPMASGDASAWRRTRRPMAAAR